MATRILLVDPDEDVVEGLAESLRRRGFKAVTASTERDFMRHMCESAPDVVVLEPDSVRSWGREFLKTRAGKSIPIVVVSRFSPNGDARKGETWLTKPISTTSLVEAVKRTANGRR